MDMSAFQLFKHNNRTNINSHIHNTLIIQYARIIKVIDIQTVIAETVIQTSLSREVYTVTLLNLSSALLEINAYPKLGDTVLLLFLQRYDPRMFIERTVNNPNATGYNRFSGVGVLMSTVKNTAQTIINFYEDNGKPVAEINSAAELYATFNNLAMITFCRAVMDSEDEQLITLCFGQGRPFVEQFLSKVTREHGFWKNNENELIELDAAVTERYSKYAPITKNIQGTQTIKVGIDDEGEDTEAGIDVTLGGTADIVLDSKSGLLAKCEKVIELRSGDNIIFEAGKKMTLKNKTQSLGAVLSDFIQAVHDVVTLGSPTAQTMNPGTKTALQALKTRCEALLEK